MQNQNILFAGESEFGARAVAHVVLPPPKAEPLHEVFAEAMLEDTCAHLHRSPLDWIASIGVHFAILAVILMMPLYFNAGLDFHKLNLTFLAPPPMPAAPPPAPLISSSASHVSRKIPAQVFKTGQLIAPTFISKAVATITGEPTPPPEEALNGVPGGVLGGIPGGQLGGVIGGILGSVPNKVPAPAPVAQGPKVPVRVGGVVKPPRLLFAPEPQYPILAKQSRISGIVTIEAVIDERGEVTGMRVISGHPLLVDAALSAVSKRRYEPTVLDGEPTPVDLRVEIRFSFS